MFTGFSEETFDFLYGIHFNNHRLWFEAHKEDYKKYLLTPLRELSRDVFAQIIDLYPDREFMTKVARIYKDARVYHGPQPYKEELWFSLRQPVEHWEDAPCFWFGLDRDQWTYGLGFYAPRPATMARHREYIEKHPARLRRLYNDLLGQNEFTLSGESYARFKPCPQPALSGWYNYKNFSILHADSDMAPICSPDLTRRLVEGISFLMPYYDYFYPLCGAAQWDHTANFQ